jgi:hypothetical protein
LRNSPQTSNPEGIVSGEKGNNMAALFYLVAAAAFFFIAALISEVINLFVW